MFYDGDRSSLRSYYSWLDRLHVVLQISLTSNPIENFEKYEYYRSERMQFRRMKRRVIAHDID